MVSPGGNKAFDPRFINAAVYANRPVKIARAQVFDSFFSVWLVFPPIKAGMNGHYMYIIKIIYKRNYVFNGRIGIHGQLRLHYPILNFRGDSNNFLARSQSFKMKRNYFKTRSLQILQINFGAYAHQM